MKIRTLIAVAVLTVHTTAEAGRPQPPPARGPAQPPPGHQPPPGSNDNQGERTNCNQQTLQQLYAVTNRWGCFGNFFSLNCALNLAEGGAANAVIPAGAAAGAAHWIGSRNEGAIARLAAAEREGRALGRVAGLLNRGMAAPATARAAAGLTRLGARISGVALLIYGAYEVGEHVAGNRCNADPQNQYMETSPSPSLQSCEPEYVYGQRVRQFLQSDRATQLNSIMNNPRLCSYYQNLIQNFEQRLTDLASRYANLQAQNVSCQAEGNANMLTFRVVEGNQHVHFSAMLEPNTNRVLDLTTRRVPINGFGGTNQVTFRPSQSESGESFSEIISSGEGPFSHGRVLRQRLLDFARLAGQNQDWRLQSMEDPLRFKHLLPRLISNCAGARANTDQTLAGPLGQHGNVTSDESQAAR